jgi:cell division transport system permease protein
LDWGKIKFFLGEVFRNFTRNASMQATAIGTVAVTVVLLGAFLYVRASVAHIGNDMLNQITASVFMNTDATPAQTEAVRTALAKDERIDTAQFVSKAQALKDLRERMKGQIDLTILTENPLPDTFRVRARRPEDVPLIAKSVAKLKGVHEVDYQADIVTRLLQIADVARKAGVAVIALFVLVAGIIISNTIRLTVFARRREISIMQLVGATNMYIRLPFICEGLLDGVLGALIAIGVLAVARASLVPKLTSALPWMQMNVVQVDLSSLVLQLFAVGGAVGIIASWISVGRYLRT